MAKKTVKKAAPKELAWRVQYIPKGPRMGPALEKVLNEFESEGRRPQIEVHPDGSRLVVGYKDPAGTPVVPEMNSLQNLMEALQQPDPITPATRAWINTLSAEAKTSDHASFMKALPVVLAKKTMGMSSEIMRDIAVQLSGHMEIVRKFHPRDCGSPTCQTEHRIEGLTLIVDFLNQRIQANVS